MWLRIKERVLIVFHMAHVSGLLSLARTIPSALYAPGLHIEILPT